MKTMVLLLLGLTFMVEVFVGLALFGLSFGLKAELERVDPDYARRVLSPSRFTFPGIRVNVYALFTQPVPSPLQGTVFLLKRLYVVSMMALALFFLAGIALMLVRPG